MFENAAKLHFATRCSIGGGAPGIEGVMHGEGCLIDESHALTAKHVWNRIKARHSWPVVQKFNGLYRAEVVYEDPDADIMVLRAVDLVRPITELPIPKIYPPLSDELLWYGKSVGMISKIDILHGDEEKSHTIFNAGTVAMIMIGSKKQFSATLSNSFISQKGMSGSAVFYPDGSIAGVFTGVFKFARDYRDLDGTLVYSADVHPTSWIKQKLISATVTASN